VLFIIKIIKTPYRANKSI